jgi:hypothetical protein
MRVSTSASVIQRHPSADRKLLLNAITLIALGLSILFLNSWDNLVVRTAVGLFWGTFLLILSGPDALRTFRRFRNNHDTQRRGSIADAN